MAEDKRKSGNFDGVEKAYRLLASKDGGRTAADHMSPATRLLEKRRKMFEVQELLEDKKNEHKQKEEVFKAREDALRRTDQELQESLIKFSKFLQENEAKRQRALKKAAEDHKVVVSKELEIKKMQATLDEMHAKRKQMKDTLTKHLKYQKYLESVVEIAREYGEYSEVDDLLRRHATLEDIYKDLHAHQQKAEQQVEELRKEISSYMKAKRDEILSLNNEISKLKKRLEALRQEAYVHEQQKDYSFHVAAQRELEYGKVHMSIANIFRRCTANSCVAHRDEHDPLDQLDVIGNYISDLGHIIKQQKVSNVK